MAIDYQIPLNAGPAGAAKVDTQIPMGTDTRVPLMAKPFEPIDVGAAQVKTAKEEDTIGSFQEAQAKRLEAQQMREEKARDKGILTEHQQNGGDLHSADGLDMALKKLGPRLSVATAMNLADRAKEQRESEVKFRDMLNKSSDAVIEHLHTVSEAATQVMNKAYRVYETTPGTEQAKLAAFNAAKPQLIADAVKNAPMLEGKLQDLNNKTPEQLKLEIGDATWMHKGVQDEALVRYHNSQANAADKLAAYRTEETVELPLKLKQKADEIAARRAKAEGAPLESDDEKTMAEFVRVSGPSVLGRFGLTPDQRRGVIHMATQLNAGEGVSAREGAVAPLILKEDQKSLGKLQPQYDALVAYEKTASKIGHALIDIAKKVDSTGTPVLERWIRAGRKSVAGDPDVTEFNSRLQTYTTESARILNNPNLTGPTTDSARHETQEVMPAASTYEQIKRGVEVMDQEFGWRKKNLGGQINEVKGRMNKGASKSGTTDSADGSNDTKVQILQTELDDAKSKLSALPANATQEDRHRVEQDVASLEREVARVKGSKKKSGAISLADYLKGRGY